MKNSYPQISLKQAERSLQQQRGLIGLVLTASHGFGPDWWVKHQLANTHNTKTQETFTSAGYVWSIGGKVQFWEAGYPWFRKKKWNPSGKTRIFFLQKESFTQPVRGFCTRQFLERRKLVFSSLVKGLASKGSGGLIPWDLHRSHLAAKSVVDAVPEYFQGLNRETIDPMEVGNVICQFTSEIYDIIL